MLKPSLLHLRQYAVLRETFDCGDLLTDHGGYGRRAGASGDTIDVDGACAAFGNAATVFGASRTDVLTDCPEQWSLRFDIHVVVFSVDVEACHMRVPFSLSQSWPLRATLKQV